MRIRYKTKPLKILLKDVLYKDFKIKVESEEEAVTLRDHLATQHAFRFNQSGRQHWQTYGHKNLYYPIRNSTGCIETDNESSLAIILFKHIVL